MATFRVSLGQTRVGNLTASVPTVMTRALLPQISLDINGPNEFPRSVGSLFYNTDDDKIYFGGTSKWKKVTDTTVGLLQSTPTNNTLLGEGAGDDITNGAHNTCLGFAAGGNTSTGSHNTFVGSGAGLANTTGAQNTFVGKEAGVTNTTGTLNVFLGYFAGRVNTTGRSNVFIGPEAGTANTAGDDNIFIGRRAGASAPGIDGALLQSRNLFIGVQAGENNTTGRSNVCVGYRSGQLITTGASNIFIGNSAGAICTTGAANICIGNAAGGDITTGQSNVIIGDASLSSGTITNAVAIGSGITGVASGRFYVRHRVAAGGTANAVWVSGGSTTSELADEGSSQRFKQNIRDYDLPTEKFLQLRPVWFQPKEGHGAYDGDMTNYPGLIAEEVAQVAPEYVAWDPVDPALPYSLRYDKFVVTLISEVKKLHQKVLALESLIG